MDISCSDHSKIVALQKVNQKSSVNSNSFGVDRISFKDAFKVSRFSYKSEVYAEYLNPCHTLFGLFFWLVACFCSLLQSELLQTIFSS